MPKVQSTANILKRNQACHQCRKRKLKCDAKRPCSTCVKSFSFAVSHSAPGTQLPSAPECTFDDVQENGASSLESPTAKSKYEKLETRINELEALLRQKNGQSDLNGTLNGLNLPMEMTDSSESPTLSSSSGQLMQTTNGSIDVSESPMNLSLDGFQPLGHIDVSNVSSLSMMWSNWPPDLPNIELLRHLVEVFFTFHHHAHRILHFSSFMASLALPPSHPKFPAAPLLHSIAAIGSLYTSAVSSPPFPDLSQTDPGEIFSEKYRLKEDRPDSFAEQQAKLAKETSEQLKYLGQDLFQVLQANVILSWFYCAYSKWAELFLASAHSTRLCVPLGLNICPPFHSITKSTRPISILPPARTVLEDEMRRNTFWLAYCVERLHGCSNGWALSLDDQDISQLLPVRGDQFEQGTLVTPHDRQWAHSNNLILTQPENQIDSFILYIKSAIIISHVKTFNLRFRARHFAGDEAVANVAGPDGSHPVDPRGSPAFIELDRIIFSFLSTFPPHLKNPITNNIVDNHLYSAILISHVAAIVLHDPHADVRKSGCISALKILTAARATLDLIYAVWSTSFDISLLDSFCSFCWFCSGRVLVRFLQAAIEVNSQEQIATLRGELDFLQSALAKFGQRIPLAFRLGKMLEDLVVSTGGPPSGVPALLAADLFPTLYD
ncbi:hypothetical protein C8J56DRAFT_919311 [Mycena floridula]|nr:hypothetical protein C8J56DRAFT_919311 [Mycena floridula]